jgi:hypothetical protein
MEYCRISNRSFNYSFLATHHTSFDTSNFESDVTEAEARLDVKRVMVTTPNTPGARARR